MPKRVVWRGMWIGLIAMGFAGCAAAEKVSPLSASLTTVTAPHVAADAVRLDGVLDEPLWRDAPSIALVRPSDALAKSPSEPTVARIIWTDAYVVVGIDCTDADVIAEADADQMYHYKFGDVIEVFLKPANQTWYWELYATPNEKRTRFFYPGRGYRGLPSTMSGPGDLVAKAKVDGTLNAWRDQDRGWTAEIAIPRADLESLGDAIAPGTPWRLLVGRYNYGQAIENVELTAWPKQPRTDFHGVDDYGLVHFTRLDDNSAATAAASPTSAAAGPEHVAHR
jgi:hypothetical protein